MTKIIMWFIRRLHNFSLTLALVLFVVLVVLTLTRIIVLELKNLSLQEEVSYLNTRKIKPVEKNTWQKL